MYGREHFFYDWVFNPLAPLNSNKLPSQIYIAHEAQKKRAYNDQVIQVEKGTYTPLLLSFSSGFVFFCLFHVFSDFHFVVEWKNRESRISIMVSRSYR